MDSQGVQRGVWMCSQGGVWIAMGVFSGCLEGCGDSHRCVLRVFRGVC